MIRTLQVIVIIAVITAIICGCSDSSNPIANTSIRNIADSNGKGLSTLSEASVILRIGVIGIWEIAGEGGVPIEPWDSVAYSINSTGDWYVSSDHGADLRRMNWRGRIGFDNWEFRFVDPDSGSEYYDWSDDTKFPDRCPFEIWNMGSDSSFVPVRIQIFILDDDESGCWSYGDRIYPFEREYYEPLPDLAQYTWPDDFHIGRIIFNDYSGQTNYPATGTVVLFETNKPDPVISNYRSLVEEPTE